MRTSLWIRLSRSFVPSRSSYAGGTQPKLKSSKAEQLIINLDSLQLLGKPNGAAESQTRNGVIKGKKFKKQNTGTWHFPDMSYIRNLDNTNTVSSGSRVIIS